MKASRYASCFVLPLAAFGLIATVYSNWGSFSSPWASFCAAVVAVVMKIPDLLIAAGGLVIPGDTVENGPMTILALITVIASLLCLNHKTEVDMMKLLDPDCPAGLKPVEKRARQAALRVATREAYVLCRVSYWAGIAPLVMLPAVFVAVMAYVGSNEYYAAPTGDIAQHLSFFLLVFVMLFSFLVSLMAPIMIREWTRKVNLLLSEYRPSKA